ncbi:glycosyltransferase family 4 protein, partial [Dolichospermum sp. ST_sed10]|nr:glycosyltransferase family 4 protein [Dolichospermum sp. ST_sed10]
MRIAIARTMPEFSMDVYAEGLVSGLRAVRPDWKIVELFPEPIDRKSRSPWIRVRKYYERFWNFPRCVEQQDVDIVHIVDAAEAHMVYWLQKTTKRTVVTCHDLINYFYSDNRVASVQLPLVSHQIWLHSIRGMGYADRIIAVSEATAKDTVQIVNLEPDRICVVPNGIDITFQPLPQIQVQIIRQRRAIEIGTLCLLNVGSNHSRKNLLNILQSLGVLKQIGLPFVFWKVGSDFTVEQKDLIQNLQLQEVVRYLGKPDRATLLEIYNAADILVSPSLFEGFGMTLLEAMACGTPVITSNVSTMPEVVGD